MKKVSLRRTVEKAIGAWRWCVSHTGIGLVYAGVAALAVLYLTGTTNSNALLCLPLILILAGTAGYVRQRKAREKY